MSHAGPRTRTPCGLLRLVPSLRGVGSGSVPGAAQGASLFLWTDHVLCVRLPIGRCSHPDSSKVCSSGTGARTGRRGAVPRALALRTRQVPWGASAPWPQRVPLPFLSQFTSSFQDTELEAGCVGCTVLGYW